MATRAMELSKHAAGLSRVAGVDEAGRGPLVGPVVAAAVVCEPGVEIDGVDDSKKLSESQREALYETITSRADVGFGVGVASKDEIDEINILQATMLAMRRAVRALPTRFAPDYVLVDGNRVPDDLGVPAECVVGGDAKVSAIAAASVVAKVTRDRMMVELHAKYPEYGFAQHKGYPTGAHFAALRRLGPCADHRTSFEPVKSMVAAKAGGAKGAKERPAQPADAKARGAKVKAAVAVRGKRDTASAAAAPTAASRVVTRGRRAASSATGPPAEAVVAPAKPRAKRKRRA